MRVHYVHFLSFTYRFRIFDGIEKDLSGFFRQLFTIKTVEYTFIVWDVFVLAQEGIMFCFGGKNSKTAVQQNIRTLCAFLALPLATAKACHYDQLAYRVDLWLNLFCVLLWSTSANTTTCMQVFWFEHMRWKKRREY